MGYVSGQSKYIVFYKHSSYGCPYIFLRKDTGGKKVSFVKGTFHICLFGSAWKPHRQVYQGYVTDFLYIELIDFPIFNVADIYITFAMFAVFILFVFIYKDEDLDFFTFGKPKPKENTGKSDPEAGNDENNTEVNGENVEQGNTDKNASEVDNG